MAILAFMKENIKKTLCQISEKILRAVLEKKHS
jgi:hypothetical protein